MFNVNIKYIKIKTTNEITYELELLFNRNLHVYYSKQCKLFMVIINYITTINKYVLTLK